MKYPVYLLLSLAFSIGCSGRDETAPTVLNNATGVSTDIQNDLWHAHRHVHDQIQVHDHEHQDGFEGGHEHPHGHTHRHAETPLGGIVVSLQRSATPGQLPSGSIPVPKRPHLEILPGLPAELGVCLLSENVHTEGVAPTAQKPISPVDEKNTQVSSKIRSADSSDHWSYWAPEVKEITIRFQLEGATYALNCEKGSVTSSTGLNGNIATFKAKLPETLRTRLTSTNARLRVAKLTIQVGASRFRVREQIYFQGEELSVFLQ